MYDDSTASVHETLNYARHFTMVHEFYCTVLNARRVWRGASKCPPNHLCFRVAGTVIVTGPGVRRAQVRLAIPADLAEALAERCWDRGFTVRATRVACRRLRISLLDPFGLEIILKPAPCVSSNAA